MLLSFIEIPLLPAAPWLKYDASAVSAMVAAFAFGPGAGIAVGVLGAIIHGILLADFYGAVMNIIVVCAYVAPAALIYAKKRNYKRAFIGLGISIIVMCAVAILGNLVVTPFYAGIPLDAVIALIIPVLIPFNLIKGFINSALTLLIYKSISNLITPAKKQVRGR